MKKEKRKGVNQWQEVLNILLHNPNAIIGFVIVAVLIILAILAPWISPYNYLEMNLRSQNRARALRIFLEQMTLDATSYPVSCMVAATPCPSDSFL